VFISQCHPALSQRDVEALFIFLPFFPRCPVFVLFKNFKWLYVCAESSVGEGRQLMMEPSGAEPAGRTYLECHLGFVGGDNRDVHHAGHHCRGQETNQSFYQAVFYLGEHGSNSVSQQQPRMKRGGRQRNSLRSCKPRDPTARPGNVALTSPQQKIKSWLVVVLAA